MGQGDGYTVPSPGVADILAKVAVILPELTDIIEKLPLSSIT